MNLLEKGPKALRSRWLVFSRIRAESVPGDRAGAGQIDQYGPQLGQIGPGKGQTVSGRQRHPFFFLTGHLLYSAQVGCRFVYYGREGTSVL